MGVFQKLRNLCQRKSEENEPLIQKRTPLPKAIALTAFLIAISSGNMYTTIFPYLPKMILWFGYPDIKVGYYAGVLGSALFTTGAIMSLVWGYLAEKYGYKEITLVTVSSLCLTTFAFSFTVDYYQALVLRLLQGLCFGSIGTIKAIIRQRCDDSNVVLGMSFIISGISMGMMVGPGLSGILVFPVDQYPEVFGSNKILKKFPLLLTYILFSLILLMATIMTYVYFPPDKRKEEAMARAKKRREMALANQGEGTGNEHGSLFNGSVEFATDSSERTGKNSASNNISVIKSFRQLFSHKPCLITCVVFFIVSLVDIGYDQLFPLYCANFKKYNGIEYSPNEISLAMLAAAVVVCILQLTILTYLMNTIGSKKVCFYGCFALVIVTPLLPLVRYVENSTLQWCLVFLQLFVCRVAVGAGFMTVNMMVNNSVGPDLLAMANGLGILASFGARLISPVLVGSVYSWSLKHIKGVSKDAIGFPFNEYFAFFVISLLSLIGMICLIKLPSSLNHGFIEEKLDEINASSPYTNVVKEHGEEDDKQRLITKSST